MTKRLLWLLMGVGMAMCSKEPTLDRDKFIGYYKVKRLCSDLNRKEWTDGIVAVEPGSKDIVQLIGIIEEPARSGYRSVKAKVTGEYFTILDDGSSADPKNQLTGNGRFNGAMLVVEYGPLVSETLNTNVTCSSTCEKIP